MGLQEDINEEFKRAKSSVFTFTHLNASDLSLIELVALRYITAHCVKEGLTGHEAAARFTAEYFGHLPDNSSVEMLHNLASDVLSERGYNPVREYFRLLQDKLHMP